MQFWPCINAVDGGGYRHHKLWWWVNPWPDWRGSGCVCFKEKHFPRKHFTLIGSQVNRKINFCRKYNPSEEGKFFPKGNCHACNKVLDKLIFWHLLPFIHTIPSHRRVYRPPVWIGSLIHPTNRSPPPVLLKKKCTDSSRSRHVIPNAKPAPPLPRCPRNPTVHHRWSRHRPTTTAGVANHLLAPSLPFPRAQDLQTLIHFLSLLSQPLHHV